MAEGMTYRLMDLFAGCGGMTRGFHDTGRFRSVFAVEFDPVAAATYEANFPEAEMLPIPIEDVGSFPPADVVIGGPPCQGFSPLNRNLRRVRTQGPVAPLPARARAESRVGVRDGERARAAQVRRVRGIQTARRASSATASKDGS